MCGWHVYIFFDSEIVFLLILFIIVNISREKNAAFTRNAQFYLSHFVICKCFFVSCNLHFLTIIKPLKLANRLTQIKTFFQATYVAWGPGIIFGVCCVIATLLQLLLPETSGKKLPQTVQELREWDAQKSNGINEHTNSL